MPRKHQMQEKQTRNALNVSYRQVTSLSWSLPSCLWWPPFCILDQEPLKGKETSRFLMEKLKCIQMTSVKAIMLYLQEISVEELEITARMQDTEKSSRSGQRHEQEKNTYLNVQIVSLCDFSKFTHQPLRAGKGKTWCHYGLHSRILEIINKS